AARVVLEAVAAEAGRGDVDDPELGAPDADAHARRLAASELSGGDHLDVVLPGDDVVAGRDRAVGPDVVGAALRGARRARQVLGLIAAVARAGSGAAPRATAPAPGPAGASRAAAAAGPARAAAAARTDPSAEGVLLQPSATLPDLEAGLDAGQERVRAHPAARQDVIDEGSQVHVDAGALGDRAVRHVVPRDAAAGHGAAPELPLDAGDVDRADAAAGGLGAAVVMDPDHQLQIVGLPIGGAAGVEPNIVGGIVGARARHRDLPARADRVGQRAHPHGHPAARRAVAPVAALLDHRVGVRRALRAVVVRRAGDREGGAVAARSVERLNAVEVAPPDVVADHVFPTQHAHLVELARQRHGFDVRRQVL